MGDHQTSTMLSVALLLCLSVVNAAPPQQLGAGMGSLQDAPSPDRSQSSLGESVQLADMAVGDQTFEAARERAKNALGRLMQDVRERREEEESVESRRVSQAAKSAADQLGEELGLEATRTKTEAIEAAAARDKIRLKKEVSAMQHSLNLLTSIQKSAHSIQEHQRAEQHAVNTAQEWLAAHSTSEQQQLEEASLMKEVSLARSAAFTLEDKASALAQKLRNVLYKKDDNQQLPEWLEHETLLQESASSSSLAATLDQAAILNG